MTAPLPITRKQRRPPELAPAPREAWPMGPELHPGDLVGQFRVEHRLGRGGMSSVYLARHVTGGAKVAIKVPNPEAVNDPAARERLINEGRMLGTLRHPNVVTLFDSAVLPSGLPYLVMEYLKGNPMSATEGLQMGVQATVHVLTQLCDALGAFHASGGVHRDVKPGNVFLVRRLDAPLTVKLLDFGISRMAGEEPRRYATAVGHVVGTPDFMPPEQLVGEKVDQRADVYAVGVIGHFMLTGVLPFASLRQKLTQPPPSASSLRGEVPPALDRVLTRAMATDLGARYRNATEMKEALATVLGARRAVSPAPVRVSDAKPAPRAPRRPVKVMDQFGIFIASCDRAVAVPGGAWLCTTERIPPCKVPVLVEVPGHEGFLAGRVVSPEQLPAQLRAGLPRGFLVEFARIESGARAALEALSP